jgi:hypothetical protein
MTGRSWIRKLFARFWIVVAAIHKKNGEPDRAVRAETSHEEVTAGRRRGAYPYRHAGKAAPGRPASRRW